jgi:phytoene/squalene synthetase
MSARHSTLIGPKMDEQRLTSLAAAITMAGSKQSYYTIRWLVDGDLVEDALCAYAYFRWVDDVIDASALPRHERLAFVARQRSMMERLYMGELPSGLWPEEQLLVDLITHERGEHVGLRSYVSNMMAVMAFDARRRGRVITRGELSDYTETLATAVMDGLSYFIGNAYEYPKTPERYLAVAGAHVCHMLRDAVEDAKVGYYNIPREVLEVSHISPSDVDAPAYREWVAGRVTLARRYFRDGKRYLLRLRHARAVLAGLAYCARFERVLNLIERDGFRLRSDYHRDRTCTPKPEARRRSPSVIPPTRYPVAGVG